MSERQIEIENLKSLREELKNYSQNISEETIYTFPTMLKAPRTFTITIREMIKDMRFNKKQDDDGELKNKTLIKKSNQSIEPVNINVNTTMFNKDNNEQNTFKDVV